MMTANGEVRRCSGWAYMTSESLGVHRNIERRTGATQRGSSPMGGGGHLAAAPQWHGDATVDGK
jgi:hypothetical protein